LVKVSKSKIAIAVSGLIVLAPLMVALSDAADAAPRPAVILSASVGSLPASSALVVVQAGQPYGATAANHYIPAGFHYPAVADQTITSGTFSIGVPDSATLAKAVRLGYGIAEFNVLVYSGSRFTSEMIPVTLSSSGANGNIQGLAQASARQVRMPRFRAFSTMPAAMRRAVRSMAISEGGAIHQANPQCVSVAYESPKEVLTRIGEVHVGNDKGLKMRWNYYSAADTTLSVGEGLASLGPWSIDGTYTITNSLGGDGGFTAGRATLAYSDGDMWYQRYHWGGENCSYYTDQGVSAVGDSIEGSNIPPQTRTAGAALASIHTGMPG